MTREKIDYIELRRKYNRMETPKLERAIANLFKKRYNDLDLDVQTEHRIASSVLVARTRTKTGTTFHMQNLVVK